MEMKKVKDFYINGQDGKIYTISIYCDAKDYEGLYAIVESKHLELRKGYSLRKDSPHTPKGQPHIHLYHRNNEILAVNMDNSGHDGSHGYIIPKYPLEYIRKNFPEFNIPENGVIESYIPGPLEGLNILLE